LCAVFAGLAARQTVGKSAVCNRDGTDDTQRPAAWAHRPLTRPCPPSFFIPSGHAPKNNNKLEKMVQLKVYPTAFLAFSAVLH